MKKTFILLGLTLSFAAGAQVPTNGLIDFWELNLNTNNSVANGQSLNAPAYYVCEWADLQTPQYAYIYSNEYFRQGPSATNSVGYYFHAPSVFQTFTCYSFVYPGGYPQNFSGTYQNYLHTPGAYSFGSQARSVAMWVKRYSGSNNSHIDIPFFVGETNGNKGFTLQLNRDTAYLATYGNLAKGPIAIDTNWHHFVGIYASDTLHLYYDGAKIATQFAPGVNTSGTEMFFGVQSNMVADHIMVYDRKLTGSEVQSIYLNCPQQTPVVSASGTGLTVDLEGDTYQWINCGNNQPISGADGQNFTPSANGEYAVTITLDGCTYTSACFTVANMSMGENGMQQVRIFPNPAVAEFIIADAVPGTQLSIIDITGKIIHSEKVTTSTQMISTSRLTDGIYFVKLEGNGQSHQIKLIVKK